MRVKSVCCGCLLLLAAMAGGRVPALQAAVPAECAAVETEVLLRGVVRDRQYHRKLPHVHILLEGTNIGTVSNAEGYFELRVPTADFRRVKFSHIGYASSYLYPSEVGEALTVWMIPTETVLSDVIVYGADPLRLVEEALDRVERNYPEQEQMLSLFYRETIQKGRRYIGVSEAVIEVLKGSYARRDVLGDRVRMHKGRQLVSQRSRDTLSVKVAGGPTLALVMDVAKNPDALLDPAYLTDYRFEMEGSTEIDGRLQYIISFRPQRRTDYPLFAGRLYIDRDRLAFTRAEFAMDLANKEVAVRSVLRRKPAGLRFNPLKIDFVIGYRSEGEKSVLNYLQSTLRAKCDWRKRLFTSVYTTQTEMVVIDRDEHPVQTISRKESFRNSQIFSDLVEEYGDADFWAGYNIIPPTESLEHAVERLRKEVQP